MPGLVAGAGSTTGVEYFLVLEMSNTEWDVAQLVRPLEQASHSQSGV